MERSDLHYGYDWHAVRGDDPNKTKEDKYMFNRHEGYEVLNLINSLRAEGGKRLSLRSEKKIEWMIHDHLPSSIRSRENVTTWICDNFTKLSPLYPH